MTPPLTARRAAFVAVAALVTPLGLLTKLYAGPGAAWVGSQLGGFFYVVFWVFVGLAFAPRAAPAAVAAAVVAVTSALEIAQLWHPPVLESIRGTRLGATLLGTTFAWSDFPWYAAGGAGAWAAARALTARRAAPGGHGA